MKTRSLPPLRVAPALRREVEAVLEEGESLSSFILDSVTRNVEARRARQAFVARGIASAERAKKTGRYVSAAAVVDKLARRLAAARSRSGG